MTAVAPTAVAATAICRDCGEAVSAPRDARCGGCGSPRLLSHPELAELTIAHVDCDAFFAAIEKRDNPALRDVPVIVGGGKRGVVSTACYIARTYGIHSAMPMFQALKLCPGAVVVPSRFEVYAEAGREVRRRMFGLTPLVQPISIDEAFLDLSGTARVHGASPAMALVRFARTVEREVGISVSVGLSYNKFLAKVASDAEKPRGFSVLGRTDAVRRIGERPIAILPGVGKKAQDRLARAGLTLVRHLAELSPADTVRLAGRDGLRLAQLARGVDDRRVHTERDTKGVSAETTFSTDLASAAELEPILWRLCEKVSGRLKAGELAGRSITLKLKDQRFRLTTRTRSGLPATQLASRLFAPARHLLRDECDGRHFRLIGIGAGDLCASSEADRGDLADPHVHDEKRIEGAIDDLRGRFGRDAVQKGLAFPWLSDDKPKGAGGRGGTSRP